MDDYGPSPMMMMQMMGPMMIAPIIMWLVIGPLLVYPLARWKAHREGVLDNQLGVKVALHYFRMMAFQILLLGATMLIYTIISKMGEKGAAYRLSFGFLVPAGIVFGVHHAMLPRTNDAHFPNVRRLFSGFNLLVTGVLGFIALVVACQLLFKKGESGDEGRVVFAATIVYCGAWAACGIQFARTVLGGFGQAQPPQNIVPPGPGPGAHQGGLPPLSAGGQYPPVNQ